MLTGTESNGDGVTVSAPAAERMLDVSFFFFVLHLAAFVSVLLCVLLGAEFAINCGIACASVIFFLIADVLKFAGLRWKRRAEDRAYFRSLADPRDRER